MIVYFLSLLTLLQVAHPFSATTTKDLKTLCDAFGTFLSPLLTTYSIQLLESSKHTKHYKIYQSSRIQKLKSELKELEASNANQWHSIYTEDPYQRGTYPFHDFYFLSYWLIRSEYQLWGSTLPTNEESLAAYIAICEAALSEIVRVLTPLLTDEAMKGKQGVNSVIRQVYCVFSLPLVCLISRSRANTSWSAWTCSTSSRRSTRSIATSVTLTLAMKALLLCD